MYPLMVAVALLTGSKAPQRDFLDTVRSTIASGLQVRIEALFNDKRNAKYLFEMTKRTNGYSRLRAAILPSPPGWKGVGPFIVVIHQFQPSEADHDPVYGTVRSPDGTLRLGAEIPEDASPGKITHLVADVHLHPDKGFVNVDASIDLNDAGAAQAEMFRLNDNYVVKGALDADSDFVDPKEGDLVRAGSLLIPWTKSPPAKLHFSYSGSLQLKERNLVNLTSEDADVLNDKVCYLTSYWYPSLGRNPFTTSVRVEGPKAWVIRSEGVPVSVTDSEWASPAAAGVDEQVVAYRNDVAISWPKVVGGLYKVAGELSENGKTFRFYQLDPVDPMRGQEMVRKMADAMADFEKLLGPFPYPSYECFQSYGYDGMESYSYTILSPRAFQYVSHEMGHTYFGGIVPCTYIHDTWNESLTQYIDSVVHLNDADKTLEAGLRTVGLAKPLSKMNIAWADGSATYFRGAYVMKMLEGEIGKDNVLKGLKAMVADRRGKLTVWDDIRQYMEGASQDPLDWFWDQWVDHATFPTLEVIDVQPIKIENKIKVSVTVQQSGTSSPFKLKYLIRLVAPGYSKEMLVSTHAPQEVFDIDCDFMPYQVSIEPFPYTLAVVKPAFTVKGGS